MGRENLLQTSALLSQKTYLRSHVIFGATPTSTNERAWVRGRRRSRQDPNLSKELFSRRQPFRNLPQARNQDLMWGGGGGGANEDKVEQTTEMYFSLSDPFI